MDRRVKLIYIRDFHANEGGIKYEVPTDFELTSEFALFRNGILQEEHRYEVNFKNRTVHIKSNNLVPSDAIELLNIGR